MEVVSASEVDEAVTVTVTVEIDWLWLNVATDAVSVFVTVTVDTLWEAEEDAEAPILLVGVTTEVITVTGTVVWIVRVETMREVE